MRCRSFPNKKRNKLGLHHTPTPETITKAYILGALHDSTERKYTFRISQKSKPYVEMISKGLKSLGYSAWIYKEGKNRNVYVVEFAKKIVNNFEIETSEDMKDYIRGYFDSEGSVPVDLNSKYYIYFAQKDLDDLKQVKRYLNHLGISCGKIHNPSIKVDPEYFRFYILSKSWNDFAYKIGSWHPRKRLRLRMKI